MVISVDRIADPWNGAAEVREVVIFTDGACRGNPGPGGYGVVMTSGKHRIELSQGFARTTNNRMELLAAISALERLKEPCAVTLHSDSRYLIDAVNKRWIEGWRSRGWVTTGKQPVKNKDLWMRLVTAAAAHRIDWLWVRGHAGNAVNERCDELAVTAATARNLPPDEGFEAAGDF